MKWIKVLPWLILVGLVITAAVLSLARHWIAGPALFVGALLFLYKALGFIPNSPPYVGVPVVLGTRYPNFILKEGWHLFLPWIYTAVLVKVEKVNLDFTFPDIRTRLRDNGNGGVALRAGGEVTIEIGLTYAPDYRSGSELISYLNSGGAKGIEDIIEDTIEEVMRDLAREFDWEQISFQTEELKARISEVLTGQRLTRQVERTMNSHGFPVEADLGIKLYRLSIGRIKEQGELARTAEKVALEQVERDAEEIELQLVQRHTQRFVDMGVTPGEAVDAVQVERRKAQKEVKSYRGLESLAEFLGRGLRR